MTTQTNAADSAVERAMRQAFKVNGPISPVWISIVTAIGSFSVALLCIWTGYELFLAGATGAFKFSAQASTGSVGLESVAPGLAFAAFGAALAAWTVHRLIGRR